MAEESLSAECACLDNDDVLLDDRTSIRLIQRLLCSINVNTAAAGGGITPITALLTQTTATAGAVSSTALAIQGTRRGGQLRNLSSTETINVNLGGTAVASATGLGHVPPLGIYALPAYYTGSVEVIRSGSVDAAVEVLSW